MYFPELLEEYKQLLGQMKLEGVTSGDLYREVKQAIEWMETGMKKQHLLQLKLKRSRMPK